MSNGTEQLLLPVFDHLLLKHPLPWTIDHDWTWEVIASDKTIIAKCITSNQAEAIVNYAEKRLIQLNKIRDEAEELVRHIQTKREV